MAFEKSSSGLYLFAPVGPYRYCYKSADSDRSVGEISECVGDLRRLECPNIEVDELHPYLGPLPEIYAAHLYSREVADFLWSPETCLVSQPVQRSLKDKGFSGFQFREAALFKNRGCTNPIGGFVEMRVTGRVPLDESRSGVEVLYKCPLCGQTRYSQWDQKKGLHFQGSIGEWPDVFEIEQPINHYIFVKEDFAKFAVEHGWRPFTLSKVEDVLPFTI